MTGSARATNGSAGWQRRFPRWFGPPPCTARWSTPTRSGTSMQAHATHPSPTAMSGDVCCTPPISRAIPLGGRRLWSRVVRLKSNAGSSALPTVRIGGFFVGRCPVRGRDHQIVRWLGACLDIDDQMRDASELRQANEALQLSNADLEQFAYAASHDLQEPLRMISLYTQLLRDEYENQLDDTARSYIGFAVTGAQRMERLLRDLLAYSQVTGVPGSKAERTDAAAALRMALENLEALIRKTGAVIRTGELPEVSIAPLHLTQLFQNLVGNALKYSGDRLPQVSIKAQRDQDHWRFSVEDNGIGIEPQYVRQVFGVFKRLHGQEYEGTGIGLAICQRIVERNGGRIWLESTPGLGSTFYFTLRG